MHNDHEHLVLSEGKANLTICCGDGEGLITTTGPYVERMKIAKALQNMTALYDEIGAGPGFQEATEEAGWTPVQTKSLISILEAFSKQPESIFCAVDIHFHSCKH